MNTEIFLEYLILFVVALIGSYSKEYLIIMQSPCVYNVRWSKIFLSTFTSFILIFSFSDWLLQHVSHKILVSVTFVTGLVGFQLLEKLATMEGIRELVHDFIEFRRMSNGSKNTDKDG